MKVKRAVVEVSGQWIGTNGEQWWAAMKEPVEVNDAEDYTSISLKTNVTFTGKTREEVLTALFAYYDTIEITVPPRSSTSLAYSKE